MQRDSIETGSKWSDIVMFSIMLALWLSLTMLIIAGLSIMQVFGRHDQIGLSDHRPPRP